MGWWKIKDVETGRVDTSHKCPTNKNLVNAVPSKDPSSDLYNGDIPADIMDKALEDINKKYETIWGRPAKKEELTAVFNFSLNALIRRRANG